MTATIVELNGIIFNNNIADANGFKWWLTEIDGWDSPPVNLQLQDQLPADGAAYTGGNYGSRAITLKGMARGSSGADSYNAMNDLNDRTNLVRGSTQLLVREPNIPKYTQVFRAGANRLTIHPGQIDFEIPLTAPDPRKFTYTTDPSPYISVNTIQAQDFVVFDVTNPGKMPSPWVATFSHLGSTSSDVTGGPGIRNDTTWHAVDMKSAFGIQGSQQLVFDSTNKTAYKYPGQTNEYGNLNVVDWWEVQPGEQTIRFYTLGGWVNFRSTVTFRYYPAWI